jgi:hypothetical protein
MRGLRGATPLVTIAVALVGVTCAFPTDKSDQIIVTLQAPSQVVLRGQAMSVYAQAFHVVGTDTQPVTNVAFAFLSGSSNTATVQNDGGGYATVTGVNSGTVDIIARAVPFEHAQQADLVLRVSNPLEIDSVRPSNAKWGDVLTVYGVGVDSMFLASLGNVSLVEYPFSRVRDQTTGLAQIRFWVPPPARSAPLAFLGAGVFGFDTATTNVGKEDTFEPNDTNAAVINLDAGGPWPGTVLAPILFANPALAFEIPDRGTELVDWFEFTRSDTTRPTTFILTYPSFGQDTLTRTFLLDSLGWAPGYSLRTPVTFVGSKWSYCKNNQFKPIQVNRESTVVALKELPSPRMHVLTFFSNPQRYGLTVIDGYITSDPRIKADRFEEDDLCTFADRPSQWIPQPAGTPLSVFQGIDTLSIDNAFDVDWHLVAVGAPSGADSSFRVRTKSLPFASTAADNSDIDVYILNSSGVQLFSATAAGSTEDLTVKLAAGLYYVVIVDYAGVPTNYSMCMSARRALLLNACNLLPSAPVPAAPKGGPKPAPSRGPQFSAPLSAGESPLGDQRRP